MDGEGSFNEEDIFKLRRMLERNLQHSPDLIETASEQVLRIPPKRRLVPLPLPSDKFTSLRPPAQRFSRVVGSPEEDKSETRGEGAIVSRSSSPDALGVVSSATTALDFSSMQNRISEMIEHTTPSPTASRHDDRRGRRSSIMVTPRTQQTLSKKLAAAKPKTIQSSLAKLGAQQVKRVRCCIQLVLTS